MSKQADRIYDSKECQELFERAYERFPDYNDEQSCDAADWILDGLIAEFPKVKWTEELKTEIYESIHAGLT